MARRPSTSRRPVVSAKPSANSDTEPNTVNHPPHYTKHPSGIECIVITEHMTFNLGNAIKYIWRAEAKNGHEDLRKAIWYIQREILRTTEKLP